MSWNEIWEALENAPGAPGPGYVVRRVHPESPLHLFVGVEHPGRQRMAALHASPAALAGVGEPPVTRGVGVHVRGPGPDGLSSVELVLADQAYRDVFASLAADVLGAVAAAPDERGGVRAFLDRMARWQRLLERAGPEGLGPEAQLGLYGELWVLRNHAIQRRGPAGVVCWTGPSRAVHDFQFGGVGLEVKTTAATDPYTVQVTSERQLDDADLNALVLFHLSLGARAGYGQTLADAVDAVRTAVVSDAPSAALFEDRLTEAGYLDAHAPRYTGVGYTLRTYRAYRVCDGFPRIVERDLPAGLTSVRYHLNLAACASFKLSQDELGALLEATDGP